MEVKHEFGIKAQIALVSFGIACGLVAVLIFLYIRTRTPAGSEFENIADLRRSMLQDDAPKGGQATLRSIIQPHPDDSLVFDLRPNLSVNFQGVPVRTNICGMRQGPVVVQKPKNTYRIALLGDSFTFGWGVEEDRIFAAVLERRLNSLSQNGLRFEVLNFGVPGYSTFQEVNRYKIDGLDFDPDAAIVFFIDNDFGYPFFVRDVGTPGNMVPATDFVRRLWKGNDPGLEEQKVKMLGLDPNSMLKDLAQTNKARGIRTYLAINPQKDWEKHLKRLWITRKRKDIRVLDIRSPFMQMVSTRGINAKELSLRTDPHPSALKHELLGEVLASYLMDLVQ
jgi:hypothetical protein